MDGLHIALTAVYGLDFIVIFNFKHIVKRKTIEMTELINYREVYRKVGAANYITGCWEGLHMTSPPYIIDSIDEYIQKHS